MRFSPIVGVVFGVAVGGGLVWAFYHRQLPKGPKVNLTFPAPSASQILLDTLAQAAKSGNPETISHYTQAIAALGLEVLPDLRPRLQNDNLPTEVLAAYLAALVEAGGDQALPDLRAFWDSPRVRGEGMKVKRSVILALAKRRSPEVGQILLDFWLEEQDSEIRTLLAQAIKTNPQVNGPIVTKAWERAKDPALSKRLMELTFEFVAVASQQDEGRVLLALDVGTPVALKTLQDVLDRAGTTNKSLALGLLEKRGDADALKTMLAYAKGGQADPGSRYQGLLAVCRKADAAGVLEITAWHEESPEIRPDVLNAVANSGNPAFKAWVEGQLAKADDQQLKTRLQFARDQLVIAKNRRDLNLKP